MCHRQPVPLPSLGSVHLSIPTGSHGNLIQTHRTDPPFYTVGAAIHSPGMSYPRSALNSRPVFGGSKERNCAFRSPADLKNVTVGSANSCSRPAPLLVYVQTSQDRSAAWLPMLLSYRPARLHRTRRRGW
jgi:hypothetical protein